MAAPPSILWILTTQWRGQALGYAGDPNARTPHLDRLSAESQNYVSALTPHPFGPFARAAILTGVPSPQNGVRDYFDPLPRSAATAAHYFRAAGYAATAYIGKWHLSARERAAALVGEAHARAPVAAEDRGGFDYWEGFESGFLLNDPWLHGTGQPDPRQFRGYQADVLVDRTIRWLDTAPPSPWFAILSLEPPHPPYAAPAAGFAPADPQSLILPGNVPRGGAVEAQARRELAGYYAHIAATDRAIGRLLAGIPRDVRVVFTSVHGDMHGAHGLFRKGWPYEESIRVPLLIRDSQLAPAIIRAPVSLLDLRVLSRAPTASSPGPVHCSMPSVVALPHQCDRTWRAVISAERKRVFTGQGRLWLEFDRAADPGELTNLAPKTAGESPPPYRSI
jgi:arylsulfatase A-like enzyme